MELLVLILNKTSCLPEILRQFMLVGIHGSTVIDSMGMLQLIGQERIEPPPIFGSLRKYVNPNHDPNKTFLVLLNEEQITSAKKVINDVTGGLDKPNIGILFTIPVSSFEGINKKD